MAVGLVVVGLIGAGFAGLAGWYAMDRTAMIGGLCRAGLPNLSRPHDVDERLLGCADLGPNQRVTGILLGDFELSNLVIGDRLRFDQNDQVTNETAWFSGAKGLMERGGDRLGEQMRRYVPGGCGMRFASVTMDGWMTVSGGKYGHLGLASKEFYADRVVSVGPPSAEVVKVYGGSLAASPEAADYCRGRERYAAQVGQ
jgi:hypothetical protein